MKLIPVFSIFLLFLVTSSCKTSKYKMQSITDENGYTYEKVTNDPYNARIYTLNNGLKVYLSENKDEPRIQTYIVVRAGSKDEPRNTTGLAHYLEHIMFKGTDEIGSSNWEIENALLNEISDLYEAHLNTNDPQEKSRIYEQIDSVSGIASQYAIPSEYAKLLTSIGGKGTNAMTVFERTQYQNDIPSNALEQWLEIESERFSQVVLRLFHTELETVYEEFNASQDNEDRKVRNAMMESLFKKHPYGTPIIGLGEHLKNPSMVNIHEFWNTFYVPNNMAICLAGDFNSDETIQLIDKYFGDFKANENLPEFKFEKEDPILEPEVKEVYSADAEYVEIGFRTDGIHSKNTKYIKLISKILRNSKAGLIDLNLIQKQKVLEAYSYEWILTDYGQFIMEGKPKDGQSLEEVKDLLLEQLEKIKNGDFEDWLIEAVINDLRLRELRRVETNRRAGTFITAFTRKLDWLDVVTELDEMSKITKKDLVDFANTYFTNNYVVVYKREGKDENVIKVDKPKITPLDINRSQESDFVKMIKELEAKESKPVFVNFEKEIIKDKLGNIEMNYIENKDNELFKLSFIIDVGKNNDRMIPLALNYLKYIGTQEYSAQEKQIELYKLGLSYNVRNQDDKSRLTIIGLNKSFSEGLKLFEQIIRNAKADEEAYIEYISSILKKRKDNKLDVNEIAYSMMNYAKYGQKSSYTNVLSEEELTSIDSQELIDLLKKIFNYEHEIFYYGPQSITEVKANLTELHLVPETFESFQKPIEFEEKVFNTNSVYIVDKEMVQTWFVFLSKIAPFDKDLMPLKDLYNKYYGNGWSSVVFQEIREAKGLAYSAWSYVSTPDKKDDSYYVRSNVKTQPDKLGVALKELLALLNTMKRSDNQFEEARQSLLKSIESERIIKDNIFWTYQDNLNRGISYDYRQDFYQTLNSATIEDMEKFFNEYIKDQNYVLLVLGNKDNIDNSMLSKYGEIKELTLEEIFNY